MGFPLVDFFRDIFAPGKTIKLSDRIAVEQAKIDVSRFAIALAVNMISCSIAKCEFKTYFGGKEKKADEYWLWNYSPNDNESGDTFIRKLVSRLLLSIEGDALVVQNAAGKLVIADSFTRTPYSFVPDVFSGITCGNFDMDHTLTSDEVLYFRLENNAIPMLLRQVLAGYNDLLNLAYGKYKRLGGRKGIVELPTNKEGNAQFQEQLKNLFDNDFRKYFQSENAVLPLANGIKYTENPDQSSKQAANVVSDIGALVDGTISRVAQAFQIPPALLIGGIADIGGPTKNFLSFCIDPLVSMLQSEIVRKRYRPADLQDGNYLRIDTARIQHVNPFDEAISADKLLSDGLYSVNELRGKFDDPPLNDPWAALHWITKNYEHITAPDDSTASSEMAAARKLILAAFGIPLKGGETD